MVEEVHYFGLKEITGKELYTYNTQGKITQHKGLNAEGEVRDLDTYTYNSKGQLSEKKLCSGKSLACNKFTYTYDSKGNLASEIHVNENGIIVKKETYTYTATGLSTHTTTYINGFVKETYDKRGSVTEVLTKITGGQNNKKVIKYDDNGNLISETLYNDLNQPYELTDYVFF
jgi:antitoxin component YwqK of YwqJK toxin-antitoxin module